MKPRLFWAVLSFFLGAAVVAAANRDNQWKAVDEAVAEGLPQTALERLQPILERARSEGAHAEATRALCRKIALEGSLQDSGAKEKITRLQAEMANVPEAMAPLVQAVLAHWYWQYFQQNRWKFLQRTQTGAGSGGDLDTWDLARILEEIDRHFQAALANDALLKKAPIGDYVELLVEGSAPDDYRPTLFDFLAHQALAFYQAGEHGAVRAEAEFEIAADGPIFDQAEAFIAWDPESAGVGGGLSALKAVRLYQELLRFHAGDQDPSAYWDVDLARLNYARNVAFGEAKNERYREALTRFIEATRFHEISARASAALARQLRDEDRFTEAREVAQRGLNAFPKSAGGAECFNLITEIESKSARIETETVWNAPWPTLDVTYRNVTKVYFRAIPLDVAQTLARPDHANHHAPSETDAEPWQGKPVLSWEADLPPTADYKERVERVRVPASLPLGYYTIAASHDPTFGSAKNQISLARVWVSRLALITRQVGQSRGYGMDGFVLNGETGEPIRGAIIEIWQQDPKHYRYVRGGNLSTDEDGRFEINSRVARNVVLVARYGKDQVGTMGGVWSHGDGSDKKRVREQTVFFTDRALYRPGQSIHYKGISLSAAPHRGEYKALAGRALQVVLRDANGREVARAEHRTNDYGSFSGVFTAPQQGVLGTMTLVTLGAAAGSTSFNVEEYKRPKFQVTLEARKAATRLDSDIGLSGTATAYTGAAIGGAQVKWRVERAVQMPYWCWWWQPPQVKAIAHGTATTDEAGRFSVQFTATPDRSVPRENEPTFSFTLFADVTDSSGETRSQQRTVRAGYASLTATLSAEEWQTADKPVELAMTTTSLDGAPQAAEGALVVHALQQPETVQRASLQPWRHWRGNDMKTRDSDPSNPDTWKLGRQVAQQTFNTDASGSAKVPLALAPGVYRASVSTRDRFDQPVTARWTIKVFDPSLQTLPIKLPNVFAAPKWSIGPGESFMALWGPGYPTGRAYVEIECAGKTLRSYWTPADRTQALVAFEADETMRGGVTVRVTYLRENRAYFNERVVEVPWSNKKLEMTWERFRSKLLPGQKETWTVTVRGSEAQRAAAEMVATLYDASLDQYRPHHWPRAFDAFRGEYTRAFSQLHNAPVPFDTALATWGSDSRGVYWSYRDFRHEILEAGASDERIMLSPFMVAEGASESRGGARAMAAARTHGQVKDMATGYGGAEASLPSPPVLKDSAHSGTPEETAPDLSHVAARKNLNETAFFFPHLTTDQSGVVKLQFTLPEALTQWRFFGFAHDADLRTGFLTDTAVTAKDLMVQPNPPRFLREGDIVEFTVKVSNQSDKTQSGRIKLNFTEPESGEPLDARLENDSAEQGFEVPPMQSRSYRWRIAVPEGLGLVTYKAVAASASLSDGEEGMLPVLSRRILVTESLPLPIRGAGTRTFEFEKLLSADESPTLRHQSLTVQMTSQPAWYAVMALPYLMEYPYECSEQIFNRYYANALARHIAGSNAKIRAVFERWKGTAALESPLEKNDALKSVLLEETPWLRQATDEAQARRNIGLLFENERLDAQAERALATLSERQLESGLWPWFPGGAPSDYISLYIVNGFGRLRHLGARVDVTPAVGALDALDAGVTTRMERVRKEENPESYVPTATDALYLYARTFFVADKPIATENREAFEFLVSQARRHWLKVGSLQSQGHLAIALNRLGDPAAAMAVLRSIKERSVENEELGRYWPGNDSSWFWHRAPIETQALLIEAFAEVGKDEAAVNDCRVWLLKQKQTQAWRTTKATADAVYAILLGGADLLASEARVEVTLGGTPVDPGITEAGTGFYEQTFSAEEIRPEMGRIVVKKTDEGVSWGGVHWQYFEDIANVTPHAATPLTLKKTMFVRETTAQGQVLSPINGVISVGDELVVRIELRTDRDMEYVHLKDQRGSGTEPVNVLSRYQYREGLAYYETTRDTASHFFFDYLPRGTYVFEYPLRVQLAGRYQSGMAEVQCMYAPEFNSHSASVGLEVK